MTTKTERITILGTPEFKAYLSREAEKEGVSVSQLVRERCEGKPATEDEALLLALVGEVKEATLRAKRSLNRGLKDAEAALAALRA